MFSLDSVMQMDFKRNLLHSKLHKRLWDDATFRWVFTAKMLNFNVYSLRNKKKTKLLCVIRRLVDGWAAFLMLKPPMSIKNRNIAISIQQFKAIWVHKSLCLFLRWGSFINRVKTSFVSSRSHHITKIYEKIAQELKKIQLADTSHHLCVYLRSNSAPESEAFLNALNYTQFSIQQWKSTPIASFATNAPPND